MKSIEKFGRLIAEELRDSALNKCLDIESGWGASVEMKGMSSSFSELSEEQRVFVRKLVTECVDTGIHDFLFALEEQKHGVKITVNGDDIGGHSDGLQGEIFTEDGWFEKYSQHRENGI